MGVPVAAYGRRAGGGTAAPSSARLGGRRAVDLECESGPAHEPSAVATVTNVHEAESAVSQAWLSSSSDDVSPITVTKAPSTSTDAEPATSRIDTVTEAVLQAASGARRAAAENVANVTLQ